MRRVWRVLVVIVSLSAAACQAFLEFGDPQGTGVQDAAAPSCPAPGAVDAASCSGFLWNGHCYEMLVVAGRVTQPRAIVMCRERGGALATITCEEEWKHARSVISLPVWLGAIRFGGGTFTWLNAEPFDFALPIDAGVEGDCLHVNRDQAWAPLPCTEGLVAYPLCERAK